MLSIKKGRVEKSLKWYMTFKCNYNCDFCFQKRAREIYNLPFDKEDYRKCSEKLVDFCKKTGRKKIFLMGGEVSILPIDDLIYSIKPILDSKEIKVIFVTNFSASNDYFLKLFKSSQNRKFFLRTSFYEEKIIFREFCEKMYNLYVMVKKENLLDKVGLGVKEVFPISDYKQKIKYEKRKKILEQIIPEIKYTRFVTFEPVANYNDFIIKDFNEEDVPEMTKVLDFINEDGTEVRKEQMLEIYNLLVSNKEHKRKCKVSLYWLYGTTILSTNCSKRVLSKDFLHEEINDDFLKKAEIKEQACASSFGCNLMFEKVFD